MFAKIFYLIKKDFQKSYADEISTLLGTPCSTGRITYQPKHRRNTRHPQGLFYIRLSLVGFCSENLQAELEVVIREVFL